MNNATQAAVKVFVGAIACAAIASPAFAVTTQLSATYFEVANSAGDPDFSVVTTPNVKLGSTLGPDGMPVATVPYGVNDVDPSTNEITWWDPALNPNVVETGTGIVTMPYASNMFAPNSTGTNDATYYETAIFKGTFTLATGGQVDFNLGSDDDSFLYVDGILIGDNPGVHAVSTVDFSAMLSAGTHTIEVFYDDRDRTQAYLSFDPSVSVSPGVPEPATWVMLAAGFAGLGLVGFRASRKGAAAT
jgi:PA14 domain